MIFLVIFTMRMCTQMHLCVDIIDGFLYKGNIFIVRKPNEIVNYVYNFIHIEYIKILYLP